MDAYRVWESYEIMLQKIRKNPEKYLSASTEGGSSKSLKVLMEFIKDYEHRCRMEIWEKGTGLGFEHYDKKVYASLMPDSFFEAKK